MFYTKSGNPIPIKLVGLDGYTPQTGKTYGDLTIAISQNWGSWSTLTSEDYIISGAGYGLYYIAILNPALTPCVLSIHVECAACRNFDDVGFVLSTNLYATWASGLTQEASVSATSVANIIESLLKYDFSTLSSEAAYSLLNALRKLRNKVYLSGNILTVCKEDGVTPAFTQTVGTNANQQPIVSLSPAT